MKILRDTDDQLIIENKPVWIAVFVSVFALVFLAVGLFSFAEERIVGVVFIFGGLVVGVVFNLAFVRRTQIILDRPRGLVELRRKSMTGYHTRTWELRHIEAAVIESTHSGDSPTHRAVLVVSDGMDAGRHPITLVYSSGSGAERATQAINGWLARAPLDSHPPTA